MFSPYQRNSLDKNKQTQGIITDGTAVVGEQRLCGNKALSRICEKYHFFTSPCLQVLDGVGTEESRLVGDEQQQRETAAAAAAASRKIHWMLIIFVFFCVFI